MADKPTPVHCPASTTFDKSQQLAVPRNALRNSSLPPSDSLHQPRPYSSSSASSSFSTAFSSSSASSLSSLFPKILPPIRYLYESGELPPSPFRQYPRATLSMERERPIPPRPMGPPPPRYHDKASASLMSPPDPIHDNFGHLNHGDNFCKPNGKGKDKLPPARAPLPMSPPISPYTKTLPPTANAIDTPFNQVIKDPVLYPGDESLPLNSSQEPLFAPSEVDQHMDSHVRDKSADRCNTVAPAERKSITLTFIPQVIDLISKNRSAWLERERAWLKADSKARNEGKKKAASAVQQATKTPQVLKPARNRTDRVSKPQPTARRARNSVSSGSSGGAVAKPGKDTSSTPEPSRRTVAPNREDKDFNALPNYCPPNESAEGYGNAFKVDWKGSPLDLSNDPYRHLLHRFELNLASQLRLDCPTYLTSKRRIFERRLECLRIGKEFRKTDAQQACKIDVNKASKIWSTYQKATWLEPHWVERWL